MDFSLFKLDIDELIKEFAEEDLKTLGDMKRLWLRRKFSYIFEAQLPINLALFMQTLYSQCVSHMISSKSPSQRLGSLYCLYCLYETQPFKPPFKIYLSLGGLQGLTSLVVVAKEKGIRAVPAIVNRMLEKNVFLFGFVDINDYSEKERLKELVNWQSACMKKMQEMLSTDTDIEEYLHMDLGKELDLEKLTKFSAEYAGTKSLAMREASQVVDVEDVKHLAEHRPTIGDEIGRIDEEWGNKKELLSQLTTSTQDPVQHHPGREDVQSGQLLLLPSEQEPRDGELQHQDGSFMGLLMGNMSPQANEEVPHTSYGNHSAFGGNDMEDGDFDWYKILE